MLIDSIHSLTLDGKDRYLVSSAQDKTIAVIDFIERELVYKLDIAEKGVMQVLYSD